MMRRKEEIKRSIGRDLEIQEKRERALDIRTDRAGVVFSILLIFFSPTYRN